MATVLNLPKNSVADIFIKIWDALPEEKRAATLLELEFLSASVSDSLVKQVSNALLMTDMVVQNQPMVTLSV